MDGPSLKTAENIGQYAMIKTTFPQPLFLAFAGSVPGAADGGEGGEDDRHHGAAGTKFNHISTDSIFCTVL